MLAIRVAACVWQTCTTQACNFVKHSRNQVITGTCMNAMQSHKILVQSASFVTKSIHHYIIHRTEAENQKYCLVLLTLLLTLTLCRLSTHLHTCKLSVTNQCPVQHQCTVRLYANPHTCCQWTAGNDFRMQVSKTLHKQCCSYSVVTDTSLKSRRY